VKEQLRRLVQRAEKMLGVTEAAEADLQLGATNELTIDEYHRFIEALSARYQLGLEDVIGASWHDNDTCGCRCCVALRRHCYPDRDQASH
jgi:hypothetical protein